MKNKKILITSLIVLILIIIISISLLFLFRKEEKVIPTKEELKTTALKAKDIVTISKIERYASKDSSNNDESVYLVKDEAMLTLRNSSLNKIGDSTNLEDSNNIGLNAALVTAFNSISKVYSSKITTEGDGAKGIYSHGQKSNIELADSTIETLGTNSSALIVNHGLITGENLTINTKAKSSPALETINKDSTIEIKNSTIETTSQASPLIFAKGKVSLSNTTGTANGSRIAVLTANANVTLNQVTAIVSGGSKGNYHESGILIYDSKNAKTTFTAHNSSLNINQSLPYYKIAPLFIVSNANAIINLTNTPLNFGSNIFLDINKSTLQLNLDNQNIIGNIDSTDSKISISLKNNSILATTIPKDTAITLDKSSTITLQKDTYLSSLNNADKTNSNINFNNHKLYINNILVERN